MPSSFVGNIPDIMVALIDMRPRPRTILDVGVGMGKYGLLVREYLPRTRRLDGIEVWPDYLSWQWQIYDRLYVHDVRNGIELPRYDLALLVDILEHFELEEAQLVLRRIGERADSLLVSTPRSLGGRYKGKNPHEVHRCVWTDEMLGEFVAAEGWGQRVIPKRNSLISLIDTRPEMVA